MSSPERQTPTTYPSPQEGDIVPRPDPTTLTTALVDRALAAFREVMETRLIALDRAVLLAAENLDKERGISSERYEAQRNELNQNALASRELIEAKLRSTDLLLGEKFDGIDKRFEERDSRTQLAAAEARLSLDAALSAAKEAVQEQNTANSRAILKSEEATQKQIDGMQTLMQSNFKSLEERIGDLKGRLDRGEGTTAGHHESKAGIYAAIAGAGGIIAIVVAAAAALAG